MRIGDEQMLDEEPRRQGGADLMFGALMRNPKDLFHPGIEPNRRVPRGDRSTRDSQPLMLEKLEHRYLTNLRRQ